MSSSDYYSSKRREKDETLITGTKNLSAAGHISTEYPPMWMKAPALCQRFPQIVSITLSMATSAVFSYFSLCQKISKGTVGYLTLALPFIIIFTALNLSALYPIEYIEKLNFVAVLFIAIGATINLVFGHSNFVTTGVDEDLGSFCGTTILSIGTMIFSFCTFILGPWEFMIGSPLLGIGLLLRNCATFANLYEVVSDRLIGNLNLAACPFLFIALAFFGIKAYQMMRLPVLGSDNFRFFGVMFYGGSIISNAVLTIVQQMTRAGVSDESYEFIVSITSMFAFIGTSIFLLDGSRVKHHCDARLEDRYPSTTYLVRHRTGLEYANVSTFLASGLNFALTIMYLVSDRQQTRTGVAEFVTNILTALSLLLFCVLALHPSLQDAVAKHEQKIVHAMYQILAGFFIFIIGTFCAGLLSLIFVIHGSENLLKTGMQVVHSISLVGAVILVKSNMSMDETPAKLLLSRPLTWENIFHPCNYVLLASVWLVVGAVFKILSYHALASLSYAWAFAILLLHFSMSYYIWESMNLAPSSDDEDYDDNLESTIDESSFLDGQTVDKEFDVLISGGGISGLFLACILGKEKINVLVCEKRLEPVSDARFAVLNSASCEHMLDVLDHDLFEELVSRSLPQNTNYGSMLLNGLGHSKARVFAAANSPPRSVLMENLHFMDDWTESRVLGCRFASQLPLRVMQSHQEEVLILQLKRYKNVELRNGWKLEDFHIDDNTGVTGRIVGVNEDEDGNNTGMVGNEKEIFVFAKYLVGCDGPASIVAKNLGIKFDGLLNLAKTKSLLVKAPGLYEKVVNTVGNTHQYQVIKKNFGLGSIVAADPSRDLWNFLFVFGDKAAEASPEETCRQFLGADNFSIIQNRHWYWNFFIARTFRKGKRAFLAGDSAHSWPPFGGLGGNTGYGDAVNLGWKLALACKGQASELLLDSYSVERRQQVLQTAMYVLRATPNPHIMKVLTSRAFYNKLYFPIIKAGWYHHNSGKHGANHFAQTGIQFGVKLNFSPVIKREEVILPDDPSCDYEPLFRAGSRLLHLGFQNGESTHSYLDSSSYTIFVINIDLIDTANGLASAMKERGVPTTVVLLPSFNPENFQGNRRHVANLLSLEHVFVARPDHIIAWRCNDSSLSKSDLIEEVASKLTGLDCNRSCLHNSYSFTCDAKTTQCYQRWLTREFRYNQRPYIFRFPMSIPVDNVTKEIAIDIARTRMKDRENKFSTTTKQGDEKYEKYGRKHVANADIARNNIGPSGFETKGDIKVSAISKLLKLANEKEAGGETVYNFATGNPSLEPPIEILNELNSLCKDAIDGSKSGMFKYTHPAGILALREYIAKEVGEWQGICDLSPDQIIITPGAQSAIVNVFETFLQPGDHVVTQTPIYPAYEHVAELWGAECKRVKFLKDNFDVDIDHLKEVASKSGKRFRVLALCSPSNPTGTIMKEETLRSICSIVEEHSKKFGRDVWIMMDNTYWRMAFYDEGVPPMLPFYRNSVLISSFSKDLSLAGERIGYVVVNPEAKHSKEIVRWITNNNDKLGNLAPPSLIQFALLNVYRKYGALPNLKDYYKDRVNLIYERMSAIGLHCLKPEGAFYLFARLPAGIDDVDFAQKLAEKGVLVVPGVAFGESGYIRVAALLSLNEINAASILMEQVLSEYAFDEIISNKEANNTELPRLGTSITIGDSD